MKIFTLWITVLPSNAVRAVQMYFDFHNDKHSIRRAHTHAHTPMSPKGLHVQGGRYLQILECVIYIYNACILQIIKTFHR